MLRSRYFVLALALFAGILLLSSNFIFAKELERQAKVILAKGDVKVQKAGKTEWSAVKTDMVLSDGDTVKTGKASTCEVSFDKDNKNVIRLYENSTAILRGKMLRQIELPQGRIRSLIKSLKKDTKFEIKTPSVIAGAKGSGWDVESGEKQDTVKAHEDEIYVETFNEQGNLINEFALREGLEVTIDRFKEAGELIELTDKDRGDWNAWKEDVGGRTNEGGAPPAESGGSSNQIHSSQDQFTNTETIGDSVAEKQEELKEQTQEVEDVGRVDNRVATEVPPVEKNTSMGTSGSGYPYP